MEVGTRFLAKQREKQIAADAGSDSPTAGDSFPSPPAANIPSPLDFLVDAHMAVTAMGPDTITDLMDQIVFMQFPKLQQMCGPGGPFFSLATENLEKRWAGFRNLLQTVAFKTQEICPPNWYFQQRLYLEFAQRTKVHIIQLLTNAEMDPDLTEEQHVSLMVNSLKNILKFEAEMTERYGNYKIAFVSNYTYSNLYVPLIT